MIGAGWRLARRWLGCGGGARWLTLALLLLACGRGLAAAESTYVVQRGDTLYGLAGRHGMSVAALAERNGLKPTAWLTVGQRLIIPSSRATARPTRPTLPAEVQQLINSAKVKSGRWKRIVIHHSGTAEGTIKGMNEYHLKVRKMENGLAYHFVIGNGRGMGDGEIYVGNRWRRQINGGHLAQASLNDTSLGICLVGNFDTTSPTPRQMQSLIALVAALQRRCGLSHSAVVTHQQMSASGTRCPGKNFPLQSLKESLRRLGP